MSAEPISRQVYTEAEYLALDESSEFRHEFVDGEILMMAGASYVHNLIVSRIAVHLGGQRAAGCEIVSGDQRVKAVVSQAYFYPDVVVVCGEPVFTGDRPDTLLNPAALIEVASASTEVYDRIVKLEHYLRIEALQHYVLVSQSRYRIEGYTRSGDGQWLYVQLDGLAGGLELNGIGCVLKAVEVYRGIQFPTGAG